MLQVITFVHTPSPLAEVLPNESPRRSNGYARADLPETPATAPEAADWLLNPHEQTHQSVFQQWLDQWRSEPRWTPPPEEPNS